MKNCDIAVLGGDGTEPEVLREALKVPHAAAQKLKPKLNHTDYDTGGERHPRAGEMLPDSVRAGLRKWPAVLPGAIGHPNDKPAILEKGLLLRARFELTRAAQSPQARAQSHFPSVN
jgi:3-isopropylmalate dehydrogenase